MNSFLAFDVRCKKPSQGSTIYECTMGGTSRNYSVSATQMNWDDAGQHCKDNNVTLAKWDDMEKFLDVGFITGEEFVFLRRKFLAENLYQTLRAPVGQRCTTTSIQFSV